MAPRKDATGLVPSASQSQQDASSEGIEDFELPRLLVTQLAKSALSPDIRFDEDTITALVKGSTVFINYLTAAAQEIAASRAHKTISGADVLKALETLEFGEFATTFQAELDAFRQGSKVDKSKSKVVPDTKGKAKEKDSPIKSEPAITQIDDRAPKAVQTVAHESDGTETATNGFTATDAEMLDMTENVLANESIETIVPIE